MSPDPQDPTVEQLDAECRDLLDQFTNAFTLMSDFGPVPDDLNAIFMVMEREGLTR